MTHKAFERMTSKGLLEVFAVQHMGGVWVESRLDGQKLTKTLGLGIVSPAKVIDGTEYTHRHGQYAITASEAALVDAAVAAAQDDYAATPDGLIARRRMLVEDIGYARAADRARRESRWAREDESGWARQDAEGKIAAAEKALTDFDAAYPEAAAAWDAKSESQHAAELANQVAYRGE